MKTGVKLKAGHTSRLVGMIATANRSAIAGVKDGGFVRVVTNRGRVFLRVYDEVKNTEVFTMSNEAWRKVRATFEERPAEVEVRALTRWERATRRLNAKNAAVVLAFVSALFVGVIGLAPLIAPGSNADFATVRDGLSSAATWQQNRLLSEKDTNELRKANEAASRVTPAPDQIANWVKVTGGIVLILSAFVSALIALRAADS